jgi:hypothetical protein
MERNDNLPHESRTCLHVVWFYTFYSDHTVQMLVLVSQWHRSGVDGSKSSAPAADSCDSRNHACPAKRIGGSNRTADLEDTKR